MLRFSILFWDSDTQTENASIYTKFGKMSTAFSGSQTLGGALENTVLLLLSPVQVLYPSSLCSALGMVVLGSCAAAPECPGDCTVYVCN